MQSGLNTYQNSTFSGCLTYGKSDLNLRRNFLDEVKGDGNSVNYKYRMHDPRLGRFFCTDPLASKFPYNSPYAFSENRVIDGVELEGLEVKVLTENNDFISGPLLLTMLDAVETKPLQDVVTHSELQEVFINLILNSPTFSHLVKGADLYQNVTIKPDYVMDGAYTNSSPNYTSDDHTYFTEATIVIGLAGKGLAGKMTWEMTNSSNYLNGTYSSLIDKSYFNKDFSKADYIREASLIEAEAGFNETIAIGEIVESRIEGNYTFNSKGNTHLDKFNGMTLDQLHENKAEFIESYSHLLSKEGTNTRENYEEEYEMIGKSPE